jgi:hypothetical protein
MAKGQMRSTKEAKKPKKNVEKPKPATSNVARPFTFDPKAGTRKP